jgi:hypothetical protein
MEGYSEIIGIVVTSTMGIVATGWGAKVIQAAIKRRIDKRNAEQDELSSLRTRVQKLEVFVGKMQTALTIAVEVIDDDDVINKIKKMFDDEIKDV